jgi:predicted ATPase
MFGLSGAHRCGKTTLALNVGEKLSIPVVITNLTEVFDKLGISPKADMPFMKRLEIQNAMLASLEKSYRNCSGSVFITDRTPFDVLGYTMAEIRRTTVNEDDIKIVQAHIRAAIDITDEYLSGIFMLKPLLNQPETPGKAQSCPFYTNHVDSCIRGALSTYLSKKVMYEPINVYDLNARIATTSRLINEYMEENF